MLPIAIENVEKNVWDGPCFCTRKCGIFADFPSLPPTNQENVLYTPIQGRKGCIYIKRGCNYSKWGCVGAGGLRKVSLT